MTSEEKQAYLEQLSELSLMGRMGVALRLFERYVRRRGLESDDVFIFLDYMWKWPLLEGETEMRDWEKQRGDLVDFGLGDELPEEMEEELMTLGVDEDYFQQWVSTVVEILWSSFFGAAQDDESMTYLQEVLALAEGCGIEFPALGPFAVSRFDQHQGWGGAISKELLSSWQEA